jgi:hypothetical protein
LPVLPRASARRLVIELTAAALARLVLNTARRFAYPFAPAIARGLDVPLTHVTSLVALNQGTGPRALTGGYVWLWGGLAAIGCLAGLLSALALGSLVWGLRGWHPRPV